MKRLLFPLSFFALLLINISALAQETCGSCNDGIDNDGDGFIDCFDSECAECTDCDGFYAGNDVTCEARPSQFPAFALTLDFASPNETTTHLGRIAIGDLDRDGIPEIATQNKYTDKVFLLNGNDGTVKNMVTINRPDYRMSIANIEDDDCGEVFAVEMSDDESKRYIVAYDCNLNLLWKSEDLKKDPAHLGYADFDRDGKPEMYYKDEIRDPLTGTRIVNGDNNNWQDFTAGPVAVDILGDEDLELVTGGKIYSVELGTRSQDAGSLTEIASMPVYYHVKQHWFSSSASSVADYNLDGFLDVITTGQDIDGVTTVFFWDVKNNQVKTYSDPIPTLSGYKKGWKNGTGRLNIGDLDGDGQLNVSFVSGRYLYALDENFELFWRVTINEETSGYTGCTLFDFNGDGQMEVVYRDERWLYIVNGNNGDVFTQKKCVSRTFVEYPIVADVDADGATEICVVCGTDDYLAGLPENFNDTPYSTNSQVRIYKSDLEPWVPARRLWNQHGYFNVNVNDDLSIPVNQQKHHLVWSSGSCTQGPNRPLNGFLNQSPFLNSDGCPTYAAPDLAIIENSLVIDQPDCPETDFTITFDFENIGDVELSGDVPVTFYQGNATGVGAIKLGTEILSLDKFKVGDVQTALNLPVSGPGAPFTLYVVLNDNGSTVPTPISLPNTDFLECDYSNNITFGDVIPNPFPLSTEKTDNITCVGSTVPPNGSARAYRLVGGVEETADYDFFWFNGPSVSATADYVGAIYSGLSAGTYSVYAMHKTAQCNSDTVQVVINDIPRDIDIAVTVDANDTNCAAPNGQLSVIVNGGEPTGNFTYAWYRGTDVITGEVVSTSHIASGLNEGEYTVVVTDKATGCADGETGEILDNTVGPVVSAEATDIICSDLNSGEVSANVAGETTGYTFEWFEGVSEKPTADFTGSTVGSLSEGDYTVIAFDNTTNCSSDPVTITINQTTPPVITSTSSTDMNSCDSSNPNGSVSVTFPGNPADFTVEWFSGANTTPPSIASGNTVTNLSAGVYTVKLTNNATGCSVAEQSTVLSNVVMPNMNLSVNPVTTCSPFDGSITVSVDVDTESDYTFSWYDGSSVKATPDYTETGNILSSLPPGFYTVQAFHNTRNCLANSQTIEVIDNAAVNITQTDAIVSVPNDCNTNDGALAVTVNSPGNTSGFDIEWYTGSTASGTPFFTETGVNTSQANNLTTGLYTVIAIDLDNGCSNTEVFDLPYADAHELNLINITNSTTCIPNNNGSIEVELIPTPLGGFDESNYELKIYAGTNTSVPPLNTLPGATGTSNYTFPGLSSGLYTIEALADASLGNCSVFTLAEVDLDATNPVIVQDSNMPNMSCSVSAASGTIEIDMDGGALASGYTINWFEGADTSAPSLGTTTGGTEGLNGEIANNLIAGTYTVEVTNSATLCSSTATYGIVENPTVVTIASADLVTSAVSRCDMNNGGATLTAINENEMPASLADYDFEWFDESMNPLVGTTNTITNLAAGTYFVIATNRFTDCASTLNEFVIDDATLNDPEITLVDFQNPTRCFQDFDGDNADNDNLIGFLEITINGSSASGYDIEWREDSGSGAVIGAATNNTRADNLIFTSTTKAYFVEVTNRDSGCSSSATYTMELDTRPVMINTSTTPVASCAAPDGTAFATVTSGLSSAYTYNWVDATGSPMGSTKELTNLAAGEYTVTATDQVDAFCEATTSVTITNEQMFPTVVIEEIAPLTVCDLTRADGVARATVNGTFIGYTFEWFEGTSDTGPVAYTGSEFSGLQDMAYTVRTTNNVTQCSSTQTITITSDVPAMTDPTVMVVSHDTHCVLDNGILSAAVNGNTSNYTFEWYTGTDTDGTPDVVGEFFTDLAAGQYTVVATSLISGCVSQATGEILEILEYPEIEFEIGNSNCNQENGFALMRLTNNVEIDKVIWTDLSSNAQVAVGPNLTEVAEGIYHVLVETAMGCQTETEVTIGTEVSPFNGISRNGDAANDFFKIDCIQSFPENVVKIFNRAGTLVYQTTGYDNSSKLFDGESNKGISPMGLNVPDGTYFYVIDKNDGSKPLSGYLEIVN